MKAVLWRRSGRILLTSAPVDSRQLSRHVTRLLNRRNLMAFAEEIEFVSLWRWARLSLLVGAVVGLAAAGVYFVLEWGESVLLWRLGGLEQPPFGAGERLFSHEHGGSVWWVLLLLPALGGLIAGAIIWRFAPEAAGAGVEPMIDAYHVRDGDIRPRVPLVKLVASLFTLGTGGSAGREGPMAQIGAGAGSYVARVLKLSARERRLLLLAGAAGGISALFRTPLGAALWCLEVLYRNDFESEGLFPCLVSSVTAYSVFTTIYEPGSLFNVPVSYDFQPAQLPFYAILGLMCAPLAVLWIKMPRVGERAFQRLQVPAFVKPAIGGLLVGIIGLCVPWVFATGYGWMQDALRPVDDPARLLPVGYKGFALLLGVAVAKMLATTCTVSSGGSGGIFAPTLFIGGFIGGAFGILFHELAPGICAQPGAFVLVGMGAFYAGIGRVPIATIILISELFGSYDLLVPLMFTEMITSLLLHRHTLYQTQVDTAQDSPAHAAEFTVDILEDLVVRDHHTVGRGTQTIPASMNLRDFLQHIATTADSYFVVHGADGRLVGTVSLSNVRPVIAEQEHLEIVLVSDAMWPFKSLAPDVDLRTALTVFLETGYDHLPVVDPETPDKVLGMLSQQQIFTAYNEELARRRMADEDSDTSEHKVERG